MGRTTIDFGIDLGTTNSGIAILRGAGSEIIKNNLDNDITPSAVFIDKRAQIQVGLRAKNRQGDEKADGDIYVEFKRRMGSDHKYEFKTSGRSMKPEEISAEVLKSLRGDVRQRLGEDIQAAVITVPAAFEQKQCAATMKAGELAGFSQCPLLQEPVAASLAYRFQDDMPKGLWLIYDFGGGTFDAAIMKAEDGSIFWINHGGNNSLGGADIDWAIVEQLIIPELVDNYDLPDFSRGKQKWRYVLAKIKNDAEAAKISLSGGNKAIIEIIEIGGFKDAHGGEVEFDFTLTRDALISVAEPFIIRSVEICKRVLQEKKLGPNEIKRIILVGGPTKADYFREILDSSLGIQLDYSVDPLTVVALGAAVFAGTQRIEGKAAPKAVVGQFNVSLKYNPMGPDRDPQIRGEVKSLDNSSVEGFTVEFVNRTDGAKELLGWRSGTIPLKADGKFNLRLEAEKGVRNTYAIELLDPHGSMRTIVPDTVVYTMMVVISEQTIINSIAVALANNEREIFFNKGEPLPAKKTIVRQSAHALHKGESGEVLNIPIVEGENEKANHNPLLGTLEIKGASIKRDLPAGIDIEVTLILDASRILTAKAYVPILDEEFKAVIEHDIRSPEYPELKKQFEQEKHRHEEMVVKANDSESKSLAILVEDIEESGKLEEIEKLLDAGRGDPDAAKQAEKRLLDLRINLDKAEDLLKWPALKTEANQAIDDLDKLIEEHDQPEHRKRADKLREQMEELVSQERAAPLRKKIEQIIDLHREILHAQPLFWVGFFEFLEKQRSKIPNAGAAERLCNQGYQCIQKEDISGLENVVRQLFKLLPREVAEKVERERGGYGSGWQ